MDIIIFIFLLVGFIFTGVKIVESKSKKRTLRLLAVICILTIVTLYFFTNIYKNYDIPIFIILLFLLVAIPLFMLRKFK